MGIFLSISHASKDLSKSQKFYTFTTNDNNEIIIDPSDFRTFIKTFRGLQSKKEDSQIELRNVVLEWKSRLRFNQETQDTRSQAYELIGTVEDLHDEQDAMLESENKKLDLLIKEEMLKRDRGHNIPRLTQNEDDEVFEDNDEGEFDEMKKEISKRQQYLRIFNDQSTSVLKLALVDIEVCQKMVDFSKDFKENDSEDQTTDEEETLPHSV